MPADLDAAVARVEAAFAGVSRPTNADLLHPDCADDMDIEHLYAVTDWRALAGEEVIGGYAALAFLSAAGFRHFVPAYLLWVLADPESGEAVVDSTVWAFHAEMYPESLRPFVRSKWALLDPAQRDAVAVFLEAMTPHHADAGAALAAWRAWDSEAQT
jgi:uncharacterized protein DUF6714